MNDNQSGESNKEKYLSKYKGHQGALTKHVTKIDVSLEPRPKRTQQKDLVNENQSEKSNKGQNKSLPNQKENQTNLKTDLNRNHPKLKTTKP